MSRANYERILHQLLEALRLQQSHCPICSGEHVCNTECPLESLWFKTDKKTE